MIYEYEIEITKDNQSEWIEKLKDVDVIKTDFTIWQAYFSSKNIKEISDAYKILVGFFMYTEIKTILILSNLLKFDEVKINNNSTFVATNVKKCKYIDLLKGSNLMINLSSTINGGFRISANSTINNIKIPEKFNFEYHNPQINTMPILKKYLARAKCVNWLKSIQ